MIGRSVVMKIVVSDSPCTSDECFSIETLNCGRKVVLWSTESMQVEVISQLNEGLGNNGTIESTTKNGHVKLTSDRTASPWSPKGKKSSKYVSLMDRVLKDRMYQQLDHKLDSVSCNESKRRNHSVLHEEILCVSGDTGDASQLELRRSSTKVCVQSAEAINGLSYGTDCKSLYTGDIVVSTLVPQGTPPHGQALSTSASRFSDTNSSTKLAAHTFYDIDLIVKASRAGACVPLVSLMSKVMGTSIVGHPVTVEVMKGLPCPLLSRSNSRRPSSKQLQRNNVSTVHKALPRFSKHLTPKSPARKRKSGGKKLGISPRKTRTLSSLTVNDHRGKKTEKKPKTIGEPVIAHIPVKLVFRRLKDALGIFSWSATCSKLAKNSLLEERNDKPARVAS